MVSTAGGIAIAVVVILVVAAVAWIVFTQLRARRLGLPPPALADYLPWKRSSSSSYGTPRPARGGVVGWFNDQVRKFKNRSNRSATGAYEQPLAGGTQRRGFGPLDPDEAWDARVGNEAETYGYYEGRDGGPVVVDTSAEYQGGGSYSMNLAGPYGRDDDDDDREEDQRGRKPSRAGNAANPFDDDAAASLRGVSPRPMEGHPRESVDTRRSVFREAV